MEIPKQPGGLRFRSDHWPVVAEGLHLLAVTGVSVRFELQGILARRRGVSLRAGSIRRIYERDLLEAGWIVCETLPTFGRHRMAVIRLSERGEDLCREFGWEVAESEWGRLLRLHAADSQPGHTGAVLAFAHHARRCGWHTLVLPDVGDPLVFPDVLLEKDGRWIYVEVELGSRKQAKWRNLLRFQGFVALCARTPLSRRARIQECRAVGASGMATDLETLYHQGKDGDDPSLWAEEWMR